MSSNLVIQSHEVDSTIIHAKLQGRIDSYSVESVQEELQSLIRIGSCRILCDLGAVEYISGAGLKAFHSIVQAARKQDGDVKFCSLSADVETVFALAGFKNIAYPFKTSEEAYGAFKSDELLSEYGKDTVVLRKPSPENPTKQ